VPPEKITAFLSAVTTVPTASRQIKAAASQYLKGKIVPVADQRAPGEPEQMGAQAQTLRPQSWAPPPPSCRKLRGYVFDPSVSTQLQYVDLSETTYKVRWEPKLKHGPVGEYLQVIDGDETPVDLNAPHLLAQDGLALGRVRAVSAADGLCRGHGNHRRF
jgi:hypothetical protein